jgi:alkylation response protein AidB-like acyl-CoA dehydrogenase
VVTTTQHTGELTATTEAGAAMIAAAGRFAEEFASGAMAHDREGTFAVEHLQKLTADRWLVAPVPTTFGGGGVASIRDVLVAASRLARGDAATAIGVNMHFAVLTNLVRAWSVAVARWDERAADRLGDTIRMVVAGDVVFASAASEPSPQDLSRPNTVATRVPDGWLVTGRKAFATMAPHATVLSVAVTFVNGRGEERYGFAMIPASSSGVVFHDDWDALGMRASASGSVSFESVHVPDGLLSDVAAAGSLTAELLDRYLVSGALHAAASLGIAEAAHAQSGAALRRRGAEQAAGDPHTVSELAANVVDVTAMRASLERAGRLIDEYHASSPMADAPAAQIQAVTAEIQASKAFVNQAAVRVVDRALALSGGSGYRAADPLAKAWRDVRAGAFMHPMGANRVGTYLAANALGLGAA